MIDSTAGSRSPQESWDLESDVMDASKRESIIRAEQPENNIVDLASSSTQANVAPKLDNGRKGLGPVTPIVPPASAQPEDEDWALSCHSPTETFDPFAPGTEDLMLAPKKNAPRVLRILSPRKLDFDSCVCNSDEEGDDHLLELLRKSFLALVLSSEMHPMSLFAESNLHDSSKTPTSLPLLTGIAETCPPAPMRRRASKSRKISDLTRRKLDFGSNEH